MDVINGWPLTHSRCRQKIGIGVANRGACDKEEKTTTTEATTSAQSSDVTEAVLIETVSESSAVAAGSEVTIDSQIVRDTTEAP